MISIKESYRLAVLYMLMRLMAADGYHDRREYLFILKIAREMGMAPEDILTLTPEDLLREEKLPVDEQERMIILYYLLFMMVADGIVSNEEEKLVRELGYQLGFRIELVADLIDVIKSYDHIHTPSAALLDKIRTYLN